MFHRKPADKRNSIFSANISKKNPLYLLYLRMRESKLDISSMENKSFLHAFSLQFKEFELRAIEINIEKSTIDLLPTRRDLLTNISKEIYLYTKAFLEFNTDILSHIEKQYVFKTYIELWEKYNLMLDISQTDYAEQYKQSRYKKYADSYIEHRPMLAGFNLSRIDLGNSSCSCLIFLSVNLEQADVSNADFAYSHFEDCNLSSIIATKKTNFNQCRFKKCNFENAELQTNNFCEVRFEQCIFIKTNLKGCRLSELDFDHCSLLGADLRGANLTHTHFKECELYQTKFDNHDQLLLYKCNNYDADSKTNLICSSVDAALDGNPLSTLQHSLLSGFTHIDAQPSMAKIAVKVGIFSPVDPPPTGSQMDVKETKKIISPSCKE